jgi:integrase
MYILTPLLHFSKKTRKSMEACPVPVSVMKELRIYADSFDSEQTRLFNKSFNHKRWKKIYQEVGLADLKFHDLRKMFDSILAQNGLSTAVTQKSLEHSSLNLTNKVYTNVDSVLRYAVEQLPVGDRLL